MTINHWRLGLDLGSTATKGVLLAPEGRIAGHIVGRETRLTGGNPAAAALAVREALFAAARITSARIVATGYGRALVTDAARTVTEITCHAAGVRHAHPDARGIIDVGGQDAKAIRLDESGAMVDFAMNDRCAAGTGVFLSGVASRLGVTADDAAEGDWPADLPEIAATCAVFAESEVVGLVARGLGARDALVAAHRAAARRLAGLARQARLEGPVYVSGGGAENRALVRAIGEALGTPVGCVEFPAHAGALGAALFA